MELLHVGLAPSHGSWSGGRWLDLAILGLDLAKPATTTFDSTHLPRLPTLVRGQRPWVARHELPDHGQPGRLVWREHAGLASHANPLSVLGGWIHMGCKLALPVGTDLQR